MPTHPSQKREGRGTLIFNGANKKSRSRNRAVADREFGGKTMLGVWESVRGGGGTLNLNPVGGWGTNSGFEPTESRYRPKKIRCWRWNR